MDKSFSHLHRRIVITRQKNVTRIKMLEYIDDVRGHGIEIVVDENGAIDVSGLGLGFASPINMFQSIGSWHWGSMNIVKDLDIDRDADCNDLASLVQNIVYSINEPIVAEFIKEFIKGYSMHGRKICAKIYFEIE